MQDREAPVAPDTELPPSLSVVIPTYRAGGTLEHVVETVIGELQDHVSALEIIIVDDDSPDRSWPEIEELAQERSEVRGVRLHRNYGQHNALLAGLRAARMDLILTMDDDLQNPPDQVPLLLAELDDETDLVYGYPSDEPQSRTRNLLSRSAKGLMGALLGPEVNRRASAFRLFRSSVVRALAHVNDPFLSIDAVLVWGTSAVKAVPVRFDKRQHGTSSYTFRRLARHALNMLTGYSTMPLRLVALIGLAFSLFGFSLVVYVVARWSLGGADVPGFTFLAAIVSLFAGVQLFGLGVIGEYLGRVHFRSMGRPAYTIRELTEEPSAAPDA